MKETKNSSIKRIKNWPNYASKLNKKRSNKINNVLSNQKLLLTTLISNQNIMIFVHLDNIMKRLIKDAKLENKIYKIVSKIISI
jgi:hypothetical protein